MLSAIANKIVTYNKVKSALLSYENVLDKIHGITSHCDIVRDPSDPIIQFYKIFIQHYLNNVGDPLTSSNLHMNSKEFEAEVMKYFANLYQLKEDNIGGYIEWDFQRSELFIMHIAVNRFKEVPHFFLRHGTSRRVSSLLEIFHVPADKITFIDKDSEHGGMDLGDLGTRLDSLKECSPVVIWLSLGDNNGTVDNLNDVRAVIKGRPNVHVHYSCSNIGILLPFLDNDYGIHFENGLDSISLPLSEFFGVPISGGIALTRKVFTDMLSMEIAVIKETDSTVPGSRMGHLQILLWVALHARGPEGIKEEIKRLQLNCRYLKSTLELNGGEIKADPFNSCIFLETHSSTLIEKWNLKKMSGFKNSYKFELLPHFTKSKLDLFIKEFRGASPKVRVKSKDSIPDEFSKIYLLSEQDRSRLEKFSNYLTDFKRTLVGYPINLEFSDKYLKDIRTILEYDVTQRSVREFEKDLFQYMSGILRIPLSELYAVITSSGSFSNLLGCLVPKAYMENPIIYVSHDAHYSIFKYTQILRMKLIIVKSQKKGELDYDDLERHIKDNLPRPAIISLNIGSTMKGAIDSIKKTKAVFNKLKLTQFHIHCDAALDGGFLPLICDTPQHGFDMGIDSLAISLHKYLGVPMPTSIFLTRKNLLKSNVEDIIEDIFSVKDGIITALIWYAVNRQRTIPPGTEAKQQLEKAEYIHQKLRDISYPAWKNPHSNLVYFKKPSPEIIAKWKLASVEELSHIVLMQHVDYDIIDEFFEDMKEYNQ
eukprot:TRINITY_DN67_c0_g1_i2.p1 TRINITY_DN67_c0_g1~~TRINITY_DN67_c0_g1_i2.p1  ORF type:complete len:763 (+),score=136.27 TRINITY_DN67_c0_g1_i2:127-2415(+)